MKRLVYSPKVNAYVKTDDGVVDISPWIVSGKVRRKVNQVSSASITLRNPQVGPSNNRHLLWTEYTKDGVTGPRFHPMDPIIITLTRLREKEIQVFTGYCDTTPYFQMYPGTCTIDASCTLKRLLHTYWDPGLPFVWQWLAGHGWDVYPQGGGLSNFGKGKDEEGQDRKDNKGDITDSGIGALLFAVMDEVGGWSKDTIFIEEIPQTVVERVAELYFQFAEDNKKAQEELHDFLHKIIGTAVFGDGGPGGNNATTGTSPGAEKAIPVIKEIAERKGIPPLLAATVCLIESGYGTNMHRDGAPYWGWYQIDIGGSRYANPGPYKKSDLLDLGWSCGAFCDTAIRDARGQPSLKNNLQQWAIKIQGVGGSSGNPAFNVASQYAGFQARAKADLERFGNVGSATGERAGAASASPDSNLLDKATVTETTVTASVYQGGPNGNGALDPNADDSSNEDAEVKKLLQSTETFGAKPGLTPMANLARSFGLRVTAGRTNHDKYTASGNVSDHYRGLALDVSNGILTPEEDAFNKFIKEKLAPLVKQLIWRNHDQFNGYPIGGHENHVHIAIKDSWAGDADATARAIVRALDGKPLGNLTPNGIDDVQASGDGNAEAIAKAAAFSTYLNLPGLFDTFESMALRGDKSLMNDKPLFPFVQQLCQASLRNFQSMPNGNFYAFFPDYFGGITAREPYWQIEDIEILDGNINLSDEALATHVYTVGDIANFDGINIVDRIQTSGVVTVFNAFMADFINPTTSGKKDTKFDPKRPNLASKDRAISFLKKYGARPLVADQPMIRNPIYESFMAYQTFCMMWSQQFVTTFQFTFMPELYPGGIIAFPNHGVQMYVDEVEHTFDYESGFTTNANLSAPAAIDKDGPRHFGAGMIRAFPGFESDHD